MFATPLLDKASAAIGQGIDFIMNDIIIGGLDRALTAVSSKAGEMVASAGSAIRDLGASGIESLTAQGAGLVRSSGQAMERSPGLPEHSQEIERPSIGSNSNVAHALAGVNLAQCVDTSQCQVNTADIGGLDPLPYGVAQTRSAGMGMMA